METKFKKRVEEIVSDFAYGMWDVTVSNDDGSHLVIPRPQINVEFETYTDAGQDLVVDITFDDNNDYENDFAQLVNELYDYWDDYDPDEEVSLWIGDDGHGTNGAPYHVTDLVEDMQNAKELIEGLEREFAKNFREEFHRSSVEYRKIEVY